MVSPPKDPMNLIKFFQILDCFYFGFWIALFRHYNRLHFASGILLDSFIGYALWVSFTWDLFGV